jgi:hypothetical protein
LIHFLVPQPPTTPVSSAGVDRRTKEQDRDEVIEEISRLLSEQTDL